MKKFDIAVLLPTRNRTDALKRSVLSLVNRAIKPFRIQFLFAFDEDDTSGTTYFTQELKPELEKRKITFNALLFEPLGYTRLNEYVNELATHADAEWLIVWNDDALMDSAAWDKEIVKYNGQFKLLAVHTHRDHPYSIFPILPYKWVDILGYVSPHQITDGYTSQIAYMADIMHRIPVHVTHDRFDLTGNNKDNTFLDRIMFEGNPRHPMDFHHPSWDQRRRYDTEKVAQYLKNELKQDISWWENIKSGKQDPWEKLKIADVNNQMRQFQVS
jgi:hypothetical protein